MLKDKIDEKILEYLRNDSRESFVEIGKKLKLSESAVRRRVKNLVDNKVIEKFTIEMGEINSTSAIVLISVDSTTDTSKVSSRLTKLYAVKTVYEITGQYSRCDTTNDRTTVLMSHDRRWNICRAFP